MPPSVAALASRDPPLRRTMHLRKGHGGREHEEGLTRVIPRSVRVHILSPGASTAREKGSVGPVQRCRECVTVR